MEKTYADRFKAIFGVSVDEIEEELAYQYSLEKQKGKTDGLSDKSTNANDSDIDYMYEILSDFDRVFGWKLFDNTLFDNTLFDLDRMIAKIDVKIAKLDQEEMNKEKQQEENTESDNCESIQDIEPGSFFENYYPQQSSSYYYNLIYSVACLYKYICNLENREAGSFIMNAKKVEDCIRYISPGYLRRLVLGVITYISESDASISTAGLDALSSNYINDICSRLYKNCDWSEQNQNQLLLSIQLIAFVYTLRSAAFERKSAFHFAVSKIALHCANQCYQSDNENCIKFSIIALMTDSVKDRQDAFNLFGLCAVGNNQYQLAYDVYCSWINKYVVDDLQLDNSIINDINRKELNQALKSDDEQEWRDRNRKTVALMYGNFAYVCGTMYDLLDSSVQKEKLMCLAKHYITLAIELDPQDGSYYCSAGTIFWDAGEKEEAVTYLKELFRKTAKFADKTYALHSILQIYKETMSKGIVNEEFNAISNNFLYYYKQLSENDENDKEQIINERDLYFLLSECSYLSEENKDLKYILLQIDNVIKDILKQLRRASYDIPDFSLHLELFHGKGISILLDCIDLNPEDELAGIQKKENHKSRIAYYTTLHSLRYLFEEIDQENGSSLNCLTMRHARYMNDPEEGLVLLQKLQDCLPKAPEELRNELYDQKFVFLKSFTGLVDQLNMWTLYGSDRENGSDCNGCCICIAPETFDIVSNIQNKSTSKVSTHLDDDFHLYNVAYIDGDNFYVNGVRNKTIEDQYNQLKNLLEILNNRLGNSSAGDMSIISNCLVRLLEKIMFLFKDISYHLEAESRLIITRDAEDRDEIKKTQEYPPKLIINPAFQVFPELILLGPKVNDSDDWIPHIQFELSKIGEKWPSSSKRSFKPMVRISRINIR